MSFQYKIIHQFFSILLIFLFNNLIKTLLKNDPCVLIFFCQSDLFMQKFFSEKFLNFLQISNYFMEKIDN